MSDDKAAVETTERITAIPFDNWDDQIRNIYAEIQRALRDAERRGLQRAAEVVRDCAAVLSSKDVLDIADALEQQATPEAAPVPRRGKPQPYVLDDEEAAL